MKRLFLAFMIAAAVIAAVWLFHPLGGSRVEAPSAFPTGSASPKKPEWLPNVAASRSVSAVAPRAFASRAERKVMTEAKRLAWLEQAGEVPEDADNNDWELAKKTSG